MKDIIGERFGRLVAESFSHKDKHGAAIWNVLCDCGVRKRVAASNLAGKTRSCGCLKRELGGVRLRTHGKSGTKTHKIWKGIHSRCYIKSASGYANYGGRGISVCERWHNFANFLSDMGECPDGLSIERRDVNRGYGPDNCFWATRVQQANNRRNNRLIEGSNETLAMASKKSPVSYEAIRARLNRGWSVDDAIGRPINHKIRSKVITANGETKTIPEWAKSLGVDASTIRGRIKDGWSEEDAVTIHKGVKRLHVAPC